MTTPLARRPTRLDRLRGRAAEALPVLVWIAAAFGVLHLLERQHAPRSILGLARESFYTVAAESAGRLAALHVAQGQQVESGETIARLEDESLVLALRRARAELERLRAELERASVEQRLEHDDARAERAAELRRFARDLEAAKVERLAAEAAQAEDRVRAGGLAVDLQRQRTLVGQQVVADAELTRLSTEHERVQARVAEREPTLVELRAAETTAQERLAQFRAAHAELADIADAALAPFHWSIEVQRARLEEFELERSKLSLLAPAAGVVARILVRPGEIVATGAPVVEILDSKPRELIAWQREPEVLDVQPGQVVEVVRHADRSRHPSRVLRTGTRIERVPERVTGTKDSIVYGLPIILACPDGVQPTPGEAFTVRLGAR